MTLRSLTTRTFGCAVLASLAFIAIAPSAHAAKNYCRKIELTGNAGVGPNKAVEFLVKDNSGVTLLNKSCPITAGSNETDVAYITRLPYAWGTDSSNPPTTCPSPGGYDPLDPLKIQCVDYAGGSCKIKSKIAPKGVGDKKKYAEVCCYADIECSGPKLGTEGTPVPITIQVEKYGSSTPCPDPNNCEDCDLCQVDPDPMGMAQLPSPSGATCRTGSCRIRRCVCGRRDEGSRRMSQGAPGRKNPRRHGLQRHTELRPKDRQCGERASQRYLLRCECVRGPSIALHARLPLVSRSLQRDQPRWLQRG
jgi:hypothetical protein